MDRRDFLKTAVIGTGALTVGTGITAEARPRTVNTPLKAQGYVKEPAKKIAVVDSADVVVAGGGPAGVAAAYAAARQGADVLLLERQYFLGGLFTGCGVTPIINMFNPTMTGREQAVFGFADELCRRLEKVGMLSQDNVIPKVDPEAAKYMMEEMLAEADVRILYGVQAAEIVMSADRIDAVIVEGKSGRVAIRSSFVVDCTGDGDILEWAGEDFTVRKNDIGSMWRIGNADSCDAGSPTCIKGVRTMHSVGEKDQDGLDMYNLTRIQLGQRKMMWEGAMKLRNSEGCEDLFLLDTPALVGVRITRVLNAVANVTAIGAAQGKSYDDVVGFTGGDSNLKVNGVKYLNRERKMWQIPYSAITPKKVSNLLVGGRCFGFEEPLTFDAREVGTCFMTGQAAGTAAAIAVASRCSSRDVDIRTLQASLREQNVKLDW